MNILWIIFIALFLAVVIIIIFINRAKKVMVDKNVKCPHCGKVIDAAFINNKLAMERKCPYCKKEIK